MPMENANDMGFKTRLQVMGLEESRYSELNKRLTSLLQKPIKGSLAKNLQKDASDLGKFTWANPTYILQFLTSAIQRYTVPSGETGKP